MKDEPFFHACIDCYNFHCLLTTFTYYIYLSVVHKILRTLHACLFNWHKAWINLKLTIQLIIFSFKYVLKIRISWHSSNKKQIHFTLITIKHLLKEHFFILKIIFNIKGHLYTLDFKKKDLYNSINQDF